MKRPYHYSVKLLNPFRGTTQVIDCGNGRALSIDGINWQVQVKSEYNSPAFTLMDQTLPKSSYLLYGIWSEKQGLSRLPLPPSPNSEQLVSVAEIVLTHLHRLPELPFPLNDVFEYWVLDKHNLQPLLLLASRIDPPPAEQPTHNDGSAVSIEWRPTLPTDNSFQPKVVKNYAYSESPNTPQTARITLAHLIQQRLTNCGIWVRRLSDGSGETITTDKLSGSIPSQFQHEAFPLLLLDTTRFVAQDLMLLNDYIRWQAPYLLTLQHLDDTTREALEIDAFKRPQVIHELYRIYPKILNPKLINAALVEAVLRKAAES